MVIERVAEKELRNGSNEAKKAGKQWGKCTGPHEELYS
jgi:hypothetical protein